LLSKGIEKRMSLPLIANSIRLSLVVGPLLLVMGCTPSSPSSDPTASSEPAAEQTATEQTATEQTATEQTATEQTIRPEASRDADTSEPPLASSATPGNQPLPRGTVEEDLWKEGWISLFDGTSMFGWEAGSEADWRIEEGTIVVTEGDQGLLCTTTQFDNYILSLEFNADPQTNSGIFLRTPLRPTDPQSDCYELNIAPPDNPFPTGSLVGRKRIEGDPRGSGWQHFEVTLDGPRVTVLLDGEQVMDYEDPAPLGRGRIGLQLNQGRVAFRNIRLKPLGLQSLFNGRDLEGWREYPEMASRFSVTEEGNLHVEDGSGQLETAELYGDFVIQLECISHAPRLNSGIFFRCIPGDRMNGYESQIHNGYRDDDRTRPVDAGTGAIFRRVNARVVAANDEEWFAKTIIADGPRMAVWVNGLQVTDWVDTRSLHENPRQGLRLEPGTIMIQGHDPTTDLSFRNLRIRELVGPGLAAGD
jgi:hypothetical protein